MADFNQNLNAILNSVYGKDVRQAIYDALVYLGNNSGSGSGNGSGTSYTPYVLPTASSTTLGGIKIGTDFTIGSDSKLNLSANKVVKKDGYTSDQILNFLHIDSNKKVVPVPLLGNLFSLGTNGLEFSTNGRLWLMQFLSKAIFSYVPAGEDDELDAAFCNAEGAFVATFAGDEVSMQIAVPVAGADCPCIATRYGTDDDWSTWNTSGSGSTTVIEGEMLSADEYPVINPYTEDDSKQNLQQAITEGALFAIETLGKVPEVVTENSKLTFIYPQNEKYIIREYEEYTEGIGTGQKAVVFPVEEGANLSILFVGETEYSTNKLGYIYALNYDFDEKKSYAETTLKWGAKFSPALTDEEKNAGDTALTYVQITVPTSPDAEVPYNAIALIVKNGAVFDYSNAFYVSTAILTAKMSKEVSGLTKNETTYPMKDSSARAITDRMYINDNGELFIDGKKIGNN